MSEREFASTKKEAISMLVMAKGGISELFQVGDPVLVTQSTTARMYLNHRTESGMTIITAVISCCRKENCSFVIYVRIVEVSTTHLESRGAAALKT
jgi:hypothetical protein